MPATYLTLDAPMTGTGICGDGEMLKAVLPFTARVFARAIVCELTPAITSRALASAYKPRILERLARPAPVQRRS